MNKKKQIKALKHIINELLNTPYHHAFGTSVLRDKCKTHWLQYIPYEYSWEELLNKNDSALESYYDEFVRGDK